MSGENLNAVPENVRFASSEGVRRKALTLDGIYDYALARLGFPIVDVEAQRTQLDVLWERVLDEYNKYLPVQKMDCLNTVSSSIHEYNFRTLERPYGRGLQDVAIVSKQQFFAPISGVFALGIPHPISHLSPDQYDIALRYIGAAKKVYSSDMDWEWEEPVLWLFAPTGYGGPFSVAYTYLQDCSSPSDMPAEDWGWVKDYFLAMLKCAVGEARGKFGGIPGPAAQTLRGGAMISEAREEMKSLEQEILSRSHARTPPLFLGGKS